VYGQVVNISARLQALAKPGELVVSDAFVQAAQMDPNAYRSLGSVALKNVPEPIECRVITASAQPRIVRHQPTT
jgi:class 3 adenylate cyclase